MFLLVSTVLLLIRIFLEYCQCVNDIPSIATDMLTRLSDLLKVRAGLTELQSCQRQCQCPIITFTFMPNVGPSLTELVHSFSV